MLEEASPGHVRLVSHAVREIVNALPRVLYKDFVRGDKLQYPDRLDAISNEWTTGLGFGASPGSPGSSPELAISPRVVALWRSLLDDHLEVSYGVSSLPAALMVACTDPEPQCSVPHDGPGRVTGFLSPPEMLERLRRVE